jgi:hypothetical protein
MAEMLLLVSAGEYSSFYPDDIFQGHPIFTSV